MKQQEILKVQLNKGNGQKFVNIPKKSTINEYDFVIMEKLKNERIKNNKQE
jgi:hypothetical protein